MTETQGQEHSKPTEIMKEVVEWLSDENPIKLETLLDADALHLAEREIDYITQQDLDFKIRHGIQYPNQPLRDGFFSMQLNSAEKEKGRVKRSILTKRLNDGYNSFFPTADKFVKRMAEHEKEVWGGKVLSKNEGFFDNLILDILDKRV